MRFQRHRPTPASPRSALLLGLALTLAACGDGPGGGPTAPAASDLRLPPAPSRPPVPIGPVDLAEGTSATATVRVRVEAFGGRTGAPDVREFAGVQVRGIAHDGAAVARGTLTDPVGRIRSVPVRLVESAASAARINRAVRRVLHDESGAAIVITELPGADGAPRAVTRISRGGQLVAELTRTWRRSGDVWLLVATTTTAYHEGRRISRMTLTVDAAARLAGTAHPAAPWRTEPLRALGDALALALLPRAAHAAVPSSAAAALSVVPAVAPAVAPAAGPAAGAAAAVPCYWRLLRLLGEGAVVAGSCGSGNFLTCAFFAYDLYEAADSWANDCT